MENKKRFHLGLDLGSREVKIALMDESGVLSLEKHPTAGFYKRFCHHDDKVVVNLAKLRIDVTSLLTCTSTGYGRNNTDLKAFTAINELKAHVYGALRQQEASDFTLLDIGGQDVKVITVKDGIIHDMDLNEKCAASCGRYLENMSQVLELSVEEVSRHYTDPVGLSATCAVFAESELIGRIAEGVSEERLCAGINHSLFQRIRPMLEKGDRKRLVVSGGVAYNHAIIHWLREMFDEVCIQDRPEYTGAIGCAAYGQKMYGKAGM